MLSDTMRKKNIDSTVTLLPSEFKGEVPAFLCKYAVDPYTLLK